MVCIEIPYFKQTKQTFNLSDHNEYSQSVEGIEEADVIEVIDHHRIGDVSTTKPILLEMKLSGPQHPSLQRYIEKIILKSQKILRRFS